MTVLLWIAFTLSGAGALGLELLWLRSASIVLGTTVATTTTVLAGYFAGLAAGSVLARHPAARPIRRYAFLELAVAASAVASYALLRWLGGDTGQTALARAGLLGRVAVVGVVIVPVTAALGATLPTLCQALTTPRLVGRRGGALYALNTVGGAAGVAAMGFGLPAAIGVHASYLAAASANALAGLIALAIGDKDVDCTEERTSRSPGSQRWLWLTAAGIGCLGVGFEVLWTVLFAQVLHNSVYSFAAVTLVFIVALAAGATASALALRAVAPMRVVAASLTIAGIASVVGFWSFVRLTGVLQYVGMQHGLSEYVGRIVGLAAISAGPAALASGAALPALWAAFGEHRSVARPVAELTAANLLGGAVGALTAGFIVLPWVGLRGGFLAGAVVYLIMAALASADTRLLRGLAYSGLVLVVLLDPIRAPLTYLKPGERLGDTRESAAGIVTVVDTGDDLQLRMDNYYVLGGSAAERNERRQGLMPLLLHPSPQRVAFVGMATGISASAAPALGVAETTVIEVVPDVAAFAKTHFGRWNADLLERRDVKLILDDGRRYLAAPGPPFDVIVSDLFIPWHASAGALYSRQMYETARRRLAPNGLFCQWLPFYQLTREEFEVIARTFLSVFPHVTLWRNDFYPNRPVLGLVGATQQVQVDLERVGRRLGGLPSWARDSLLAAPRAIGMLYVGDLSLVPELLARAPLNDDDRPVIEFLAPRLTRMTAAGDKDWLTGSALADYTEMLTARLAGKAESALPPTQGAGEARRAGAALFRYAIAASAGDGTTAAARMRDVGELVPDVVASANRELDNGDFADVRRTLGSLRREQERLRQQLQSMEQRLRPLGTRP